MSALSWSPPALFGQISHGAFFPFREPRATGKDRKRPPFATGRGGDSGHRAHTLSSPHPPTSGLTRGRSEGLELLSDILMSGRPDLIIFNVWGLFWEGVGGECTRSGRERRGDRACQSEGLTDRRAVGTGDRGHPGPLWPDAGAFYWFIKLLTPHHPPHRKRSGRWMERSCQWGGRGPRTRGEGKGGRKMSKRGLWVNLSESGQRFGDGKAWIYTSNNQKVVNTVLKCLDDLTRAKYEKKYPSCALTFQT